MPHDHNQATRLDINLHIKTMVIAEMERTCQVLMVDKFKGQMNEFLKLRGVLDEGPFISVRNSQQLSGFHGTISSFTYNLLSVK